uniref:ATP-dependent DNA helicase n=1 Tax=Setaria italica TaxID=4555 RepID=K3Y1E1_SETIT
KKCMHERERYANMQPNQKTAKLEQVSANRARRRDTLSKKSIAMENPTNRNENFTARTMEKTPALPDEDCSTNTKVIDDLESLKQPTNMKEGNTPNCIYDSHNQIKHASIFTITSLISFILQITTEWEDMEVEIKENESTVPEDSNINDPYDIVYSNIPDNTYMLKPIENCKYCDAKKFHHEPEGLCCRKGQIKLANLETPHQLMRLWTSNNSDAIHFRKNIRFFNGHFSVTSLYCRLDRDTTTMRNSGIYTFRAHGQIYHNIRSFAKDGSDPKHLELYFYDDDPTLEHHYRYCRKEMYEQDKHRTYNAPITSEVAAVWIEGNERRNTFDRNVILHGNNNEIQGIRSYTGCYDPLSYPLFFPRGELGWHADIPKVGITTEDVKKARANQNNKNNDPDSSGRMWVTMREYYCYKFHVRPNIFNPILYGGRLFQQFAVDTYIKIESSRLDFISNHQKEIRADLYQGLLDSIHAGQDRGDAVDKRTVLSSSFIGGPRDKIRRYLDAMALVRKYGKPDIFLTMTCNPNWEEITNELEFGQTPQDRPDLVVHVFRAKLEEMKKQLLEEHILGKVKAYTYVVEFQKRGLPHAHFLLIMTRKYKLTCPEQYDRLISAELPNKQKYPELYKMVIKHMMHRPCGTLNKNCPCTKNRKSCKNYYPRQFNATTIQGKDSYPLYRRRDDDHNEIVRGNKLDNRWVVPYNPYLLQMFNCHINVEVCSSIKAVKYLYKYIYKGHDRASVCVNGTSEKEDIDEIRQYRDARWVTPPEALWRIYGFELSKTNPPVMQLQLHLPNMHMVSYHGKKEITEVINREGVEKSMLTAYFEANRTHEKARGILYRDFPEHYTWQTQGKFWQQRKRKTLYQVGRIVSAHPAEGERYYLRVLLNHVKGTTCYEELRTIDGQILPSFREAAERRGLIEADNTLDDCLTEVELFRMPSLLRRLFAMILVFCEPHDIHALWNNHIEAMSEDYRRNCKNARTVEQMVLINIRDMLQSMGKDIRSFPLPEIDEQNDTKDNTPREITEESNIEVDPEDMELPKHLNDEQKAAYNEILTAVDRKIALATATSGVAASIMPGGRTAHSRFKIPLRIDDGAICSFTKQSGTAKLLQATSLIIWDEASMTKRQAIEALDKSMRDIMDIPNLPFGGKTMVFGGDFRQVLPVVRKGTRSQIVDASLCRSEFWNCMRHMKLVRNMRAQNDPWFAEYLLRIGNGTEETNDKGEIRLPKNICIPRTMDDSGLDRLIDSVYQMNSACLEDPNYITSRAILSTRNDCVDRINLKMIERFQGEEMVYHSFDTVEDDPHNYYPPEFLNTLTPNGLPPHMLKLKVNCPIILLRNIDLANGLCSGTRLVVRGFQKNAIDAEIVLGQHYGTRVFLPRIPLCPSDDEMFPFRFKWKQFLVRLSFAMTINKAQGQTIPNVGIYLPEPVFSHGQLYVALSRATTAKNIKILTTENDDEDENQKQDNKIKPSEKNKKKKKRKSKSDMSDKKEVNQKDTTDRYTKNIVYSEVLTK